MRILMAAMRYPIEPGHSFLTTELADALCDVGHDVEVLHLDWEAPNGGTVEELQGAGGQRVIRCTPRWISGAGTLVRHASKFVLSGRQAAQVARQAFDLQSFDAVIMWMPALAFGSLARLAKEAGIPNRLLIVWDFFPDHYREIGRIPAGPISAIARRREQALLRHFTAIFCTFERNAKYLRKHYALHDGQTVHVTPIWCDTTPLTLPERTTMRTRHDLPEDAPLAVFGGQLTAGRGFDQMLAAADLAAQEHSPLQFLFVGEGPFADRLRQRAEQGGNVHYRPGMSRQTYLDLISACDVGMVATVSGVTSYAFPSKTLDYLRAGLPVAAAVEPGNEFVPLLEKYRVGSGVDFGDARGFLRLAERLATNPATRAGARTQAPRCLAEVFDVSHAVSALTAAIR